MHRQALRAWLLSFPGLDYLRKVTPCDEWKLGYKVMAGGTPANPAALALIKNCGDQAHEDFHDRGL